MRNEEHAEEQCSAQFREEQNNGDKSDTSKADESDSTWQPTDPKESHIVVILQNFITPLNFITNK